MSLLRTLPSRVLPLTRTRVFSTSPFVSRSVVEGTKDTLDAINRLAGNAAAKGIQKGGKIIHHAFATFVGSTAFVDGNIFV